MLRKRCRFPVLESARHHEPKKEHQGDLGHAENARKESRLRSWNRVKHHTKCALLSASAEYLLPKRGAVQLEEGHHVVPPTSRVGTNLHRDESPVDEAREDEVH